MLFERQNYKLGIVFVGVQHKGMSRNQSTQTSKKKRTKNCGIQCMPEEFEQLCIKVNGKASDKEFIPAKLVFYLYWSTF